MSGFNGIKSFNEVHVDIACKIVRANALADTIQWYRYMRGSSYE